MSDLTVSTATVNRMLAAERTLSQLGYTYEGGELWKPPLGKRERRPFDLEAAKRGEPIVALCGRPARFLAHVPEASKEFRVQAFIQGEPYAHAFDENGGYTLGRKRFDWLFMAP